MIQEGQKQLCIQLYREGNLSIKEIMLRTGIRSSQSVFRIVTKAGIPLRRRYVARKASITFDEGTWRIIEQEKPGNLSKFICEAVKGAYTRQTS